MDNTMSCSVLGQCAEESRPHPLRSDKHKVHPLFTTQLCCGYFASAMCVCKLHVVVYTGTIVTDVPMQEACWHYSHRAHRHYMYNYCRCVSYASLPK